MRRVGQGILHDIHDRLPFYLSDWTDAYNYRVVPSTILTFFTNIFPAIAFAQDMFDRTDDSFGVNEVLLASALAGIIFGIVGGQPLVIVGVTGPITIFNYTVYDLLKKMDNVNYFGFMFWVSIWAMIFHIAIAVTNGVGMLRYVTRFSCDVFGMFINVIYLQKAVEILSRQFHPHDDGVSGFASVVVAITMGVVGFAGNNLNETQYFKPWIRQFVVDYTTPAAVVFFSGMIHFGGYFNNVDFEKLPITKAFKPTGRSSWIDVHLEVKYVFLALPFGIILTILFYFDHSVSALMAQDSKFKLKKPSAFHYDFMLLGITTGISGLLGVPCPNGLIPQAPLHTESLIIKDKSGIKGVVEQRVTNTLQGLMLLGMMSRPMLVCLGEIPQAVLAGLFFIMGATGLHGNEIVQRIRFLISDDKEGPLVIVPRKKLIQFLVFSLIFFAAEVAIVSTKGAIGFPLVLLLSVIVTLWFPKWFKDEELQVLDGPVAHEETLKNL